MPRLPVLTFAEHIVGMANRNLLYGEKLAIVLPVSSTLPKDGFKPAPCERAFFFAQFPSDQRKNPRSMSMRVPLSSLIPDQGLDFCERIMSLKLSRVYM
jgi:hypothetical protein